MPKPIFIIDIAWSGPIDKSVTDYCNNIKGQLQDDYHVFINFDGNLKETNYRMFSDKEIEPIELEKLKEILNLKVDEKN